MMPSRDINQLSPVLQVLCARFLQKCKDANINAFVTQTYRSVEEQNADYAQGRTTPGRIITDARGGQSPHNCADSNGMPCAKAFDFAIKNEDGALNWDASSDPWQTAIRIGLSLGLVSGSKWHSIKDNPHLELFNWQQSV